MFPMPCRSAAAFALITLALAHPAFADTMPGKAHPRPVHHAAHHSRLAATSTITPLTAPARLAASDNAAPVPDLAIAPPVDTADQTTSLAPAVMQIHYPPQGDGYVSGSSAQAMDDRDAAKVTGVLLHMPLGQ
jgi:hypothetical protein